uniref:SAM domain-containing protein n=1 Tax=Anopheles maculatus TaxID=74869 RepID=A0A182SHC7_9DIPT
SLFKTRPPVPFKPGQRLEVVDRKQKKLIRPAKVVATDGYEVSLCFEGWPREYAFWIEDDSTDLHPVNWCARTKHPLEPPPNFLLATCTYDGTCELKFCLSRGNSKYPQKKFHDRSAECPYKRANWMSEDRKPLRISHDQVHKHNYEEAPPVEEGQNVNAKHDTKPGSRKNVPASAVNVLKLEETKRRASVASNAPASLIPTKRIKQETEELLSTATSPATTPTPPPSRDPSKERVVRTKEAETTATSSSSNAPTTHARAAANESIRIARPAIEEYGPRLMHSYEVWQRHSRYLDECTEHTGALRKNPLHWTTDEMARYIEQLPGCAEYAGKIRHEEITGRSFLSFTQADLIDYLGVKMGPAIKIYNRIIRL